MSDLAHAITLIVAKSADQRQLAKSVGAFLIKNRETSHVLNLKRALLKLQEKNNGIVEANIVSARPISTEAKTQLITLLGKKDVVWHETLDESLLGGAVITTDHTRLDLSVRKKLSRLMK